MPPRRLGGSGAQPRGPAAQHSPPPGPQVGHSLLCHHGSRKNEVSLEDGARGHEVMEKEERRWSGDRYTGPKTWVLGASEWPAVCSGARGPPKPRVAVLRLQATPWP